MHVLRQILLLKGRLSRRQFWLQMLLLWALFYGVWEVAGLAPQGPELWLINGPMLWLVLTQCVRRLHDRNYAGWWLLAVVVPVFGAGWLVWQLALRRGLEQANRWGEDPMYVKGDFLTVR